MEAIYYFLNHYGYLGIFLLLALGIFGPPVADELLLLFLGYLVLKGNLHFIPTLVVCFIINYYYYGRHIRGRVSSKSRQPIFSR